MRRLEPHEYEAGLEVLSAFEREAKRDPRAAGVEHPALPGLWVAETSSLLRRLPRIVIVYTIEDAAGVVRAWNLFRL